MKNFGRPTFIAEVKTDSPFGWHSENSWDTLFKIADASGDMISIHTDPRWKGSIELIQKARDLSSKPILAKGIHPRDNEIEAALAAGANFVLVVGRLPRVDLLPFCYIEPLNLQQLVEFDSQVERMVWNTRDLSDGSSKDESWQEARRLRTGWLCQASNITTPNDIQADADAIIVGQHLPEFTNHYKKPII